MGILVNKTSLLGDQMVEQFIFSISRQILLLYLSGLNTMEEVLNKEQLAKVLFRVESLSRTRVSYLGLSASRDKDKSEQSLRTLSFNKTKNRL